MAARSRITHESIEAFLQQVSPSSSTRRLPQVLRQENGLGGKREPSQPVPTPSGISQAQQDTSAQMEDYKARPDGPETRSIAACMS